MTDLELKSINIHVVGLIFPEDEEDTEENTSELFPEDEVEK